MLLAPLVQPAPTLPLVGSRTAHQLRVPGTRAPEARVACGPTLALFGFAAVAGLGLADRKGRRTARRALSKDEWRARCSNSSGGQVTFDVSVTKPLGVELREFPDRPGVGVAQIMPGGGVSNLNEQVLVKGAEGMWVLEGDEVVAVNGAPCAGGDMDSVVPLIGAADATVRLTLVRNWLKTPKGPIKVVFLPSGDSTSVNRTTPLSEVARSCEEQVRYGCRGGHCGSCWHQEISTGKVFKLCCESVPTNWDNTMPLILKADPQKLGLEDISAPSLV
ncbi:unnamed protein product [Polarella glacialis]|uniref:PDZ domain-containing protein n=1 Tax=Polarella glacialis TaxID=89957 RepID=A0A813DEG6_POLGL|nr:unnamed protein product [Polarella glacialis]CAE8716930.1 unnamed protein product [Polarella glacialis]|mmetsp:Transcript_65738/g.105968  ORF Transcript_65738/g.105968 Transcript_65738/m.105968 type:complete len:276 (-) Transcript_65738:59-886(-)